MKNIILLLTLTLFVTSSVASATSINIIQKGISGSITSEICYETDYIDTEQDFVIIGTELGIYIFTSNGTLNNFIQTSSRVTNIVTISDANGNDQNEIIFSTTNTYFPNVLCYDILTGEKIWDFSSETEVFDMDMLWTTKQVEVFDIEVSESNEVIYLTAGYNVYCLNSENGQRLSMFEGTDNMWEITLIHDGVFVGDQNGYVYRLEEESLDFIWKQLTSKSYNVVNPSTKEMLGTVKRSVWDIAGLSIDNNQKISVSCEDGYVYILDYEEGTIQNSVEIIDYVDSLLYSYYGDYPLPTSSYDYNFFNLRLKIIPDVTNDGFEDIMAYTYPSGKTGGEYQGAKMGTYIINSQTLEIKAKNENLDLSKITTLETITNTTLQETFVLLPSGKSGSLEKIKLISTKDCSTYQTISINSTAGSSGQNTYMIKTLEDEFFLLSSRYGDVIKTDMNGNIAWTYQRLLNIDIEHADLVGTNEMDLFVYSTENINDDDSLENTPSRVFYAIDVDTKSIEWSYEMSYEEYLNTTGLQGVQVFGDINNDGKNDIVAYKQRPHDWGRGDEYGNYTRIVVFSGNGSILYEKPLTTDTYYGFYEEFLTNPAYYSTISPEELQWMRRDRRIRKTIESLDIISDVTGDGVSDFLVGGWSDVFIVDSSNGEIIWTRTYNKDYYENPSASGINPMENYEWNWADNERLHYYSLGDHNEDGYDELLQVSWENMFILKSRHLGTSFEYMVYKEISFTDGHFEKENLKIIDDVNGDGQLDIVCLIHVEDSPSIYKVLNGQTGAELLEFERDGTTMDLGVADFNNDGFSDSIVFYAYGSGGPRLEVLSGSSNEVLWSYLEYEETWMIRDVYGISSIMPACYIEDINNDGADDFVIGRSLPWDAGADLLVYDLKNNKLLKTIELESIESEKEMRDIRWQPAIITAHLSDFTGDDIGEIAVVMALGKSNQKQLKLLIVDVANEEIISDFIAKGTKVEDFGNMIATYGTGGELYLLSPEKNISITSPTSGKSLISPVTLTWSEGESETVKIVQVDNKNIMKVSGENAIFDLKEGDRKISVYSFDKYGKGVYANVDVTVEKNSATQIPLTLIFIVLICVLFSPTIVPMALKKIRTNRMEQNKEGRTK